MIATSFLEKLAVKIIADFENNIESIKVVLPNKRAKIFLLNEIKGKTDKTFFAPQILSVEELIQEISGVRSVDSIEVLFEFYEVYLSLTLKEEQQSFDAFANWAKIALQDFNEIDRYLLEPVKVFQYLSEVKALERWDVSKEDKTELVNKYLQFWQLLPNYYFQLYETLLSKKIGYQGLIYREAVNQLNSYSVNQQFVFAGFNALNNAEEKLILHFQNKLKATVFWDIDEYFLSNEYHDVGLFIRRYKKEWKTFNAHPFNWVTQDFQQKKNLQIIGTPKSIGQAKIAGKTIENFIQNGENLSNCAVVLGDENLLLPLLNSLPKSVSNLNITMGYPSKNNPAFLLILHLLKLHHNALKRNDNSYTYYYKDVIAVLNHPLIESQANIQEIVQKIRNENFTFFNYSTLQRLKDSCKNVNEALFELLLKPFEESNSSLIINRLKTVLSTIKQRLNSDDENDKLVQTFIFSVYNVLNKIDTYQERYNRIDSMETLLIIYKQLLDISEVSFEGEPLSGLQIMGVLESRVLDFKNVIITSVNEGKFPSGKTQQSFLPFDIKKELGLPTYKEKDAIYSYHFYHLLFRAENIILLYNTDNEGIDAGEKSRFLQQLEIENLPNHKIEKYTYNAVLPQKSYEKREIPKSDSLLERLKEIATDKGFSPSSLTSYIRNPIQFYLQRVLRINETDEVEESIAANTLGTIIHDSLEELYKPHLLCELNLKINQEMVSRINEVVLRKFKEIYKEGNITKGKNYLAFEVAKRNIFNFLKHERNCLEQGEKIIVLETEANMHCFIDNNKLPYKVKISGKVDRIENRNGKIRIVDYKTGKVEARSLKISSFDGLTTDSTNDKVIQLLCYALMYQEKCSLPIEGIEVGIISFKNLKNGFLPFKLEDNVKIDSELLTNFTDELVVLIHEILSGSKNIVEIV